MNVNGKAINTKNILLVEDHPLHSLGIKQLLSVVPEYKVIGEVRDGLHAYAMCQRLNPDLILMDLGLPGMDGIDVICQLKKRWRTLKIIVLTADSVEHRAKEALKAGANGYISKKSAHHTLLTALKKVTTHGAIFLDPELNVSEILDERQENKSTPLTVRERQVLKLISEEQRNRDIAEALKITIKTVETHRLNLMRKLNTHSAVGLAKWAYRLGFYA